MTTPAMTLVSVDFAGAVLADQRVDLAALRSKSTPSIAGTPA